jgi:uncharacterized protein (DUF1684 family)
VETIVVHAQHTIEGRPSAGDLLRAIRRERAAKDSFFRTSAHSPIPRSAQLDFRGLTYYPVDLAYRLADVRLAPYGGDGPPEFQIPTSDGRLRPARRVGSLHFALGGRTHALTAYDLSGGDDHALFVPFLDPTSGPETYGAGRYLDLEPEPDGTYVLDFNLAYHPYCAYAAEYSCPLTPAENRLGVRIEAGERLPLDHDGVL